VELALEFNYSWSKRWWKSPLWVPAAIRRVVKEKDVERLVPSAAEGHEVSRYDSEQQE
jgi:hypothetical protein